MPKVDTAYIIGVIREKEKGLLEDDEYTRIIQAPTGQEAVRVLVDTPYGIYLEQTGSIFEAITAHLTDEMRWLQEVVDKEEIISFLAARYDGLHIARALIKYQAGKAKPGQVASPSTLSHALLSSVIWDNEGLEDIPVVWRSFLAQERELLTSDQWNASAMLERVGKQVIAIMKQTARGEFMSAIAELVEQRLTLDVSLRPLTTEFQATALPDRPAWMPPAGLDEVAHGTGSTAYERAWDEQLMELIRSQRSNPVGYDPIIAYWYAKEIEARTVRLMLSAKLGGIAPAALQLLKRPLYLAA